jgi:micrococcal nuclease
MIPLLRAMLSLAIAALPWISPSPILADTFAARVVAVVDGDTIEVLKGQRRERIELHGIDCPEKGQPFGPQAKEATAELTVGQQVSIVKRGKDKNRHIVADVLLPDGKNLNQKLVLNGWCWWHPKYAPKDMALQQAEQVAKAMKKGLWADEKPVPPWLYRRLRLGAYP